MLIYWSFNSELEKIAGPKGKTPSGSSSGDSSGSNQDHEPENGEDSNVSESPKKGMNQIQINAY